MSKWKIEDTHGMPQCGAEIIEFDSFGETENYLWSDMENCAPEYDEFTEYPVDSILWRIANGYAGYMEISA